MVLISPNTKNTNTRRIMLLFLCYAFLLFFRNINDIKFPNFYGEESWVYYKNAFEQGIVSLWIPHQGYFSLFQNAISLLNVWLIPIEQAPLFNTFIAMALELFILWYLFFQNFSFTLSFIEKAILGTFLIVGSDDCFTYGITCSNFKLALLAVLLFFTSETKDKWNSKSILLLLLCVLSSVQACMLTPIFFYKWIKSRSLNNLLLMITCGFGCIIQFMAIYWTSQHDTDYTFLSRLYYHGPPDVGLIIFKFCLQFLSWNFMAQFEEINRMVCLGLIFYFGRLMYLSWNQITFRYLFYIIMVFSVLSHLSSFGMFGGSRYHYVSNIMFVLSIILHAKKGAKDLHYILLLFLMFCAIFSYTNWNRGYTYIWSQEISAWKKNESSELHVYPAWNGKPQTFKLKRLQ